MPLFTKKPVTIEAITFDDLVTHGLANCGTNSYKGMPWSFQYKDHPISHENDNCYLIPTLEGTMHFKRGDMLITGVNGEIYPCKMDIFEKTYVPVEESNTVGDGCPQNPVSMDGGLLQDDKHEA